MDIIYLRITALMGFLAVALGAFGAHGLKGTLTTHGTLEIWKTAVEYHFFHVLALLFLCSQNAISKGAFFSFLCGILIFSGSLYILAVTNTRWLGAITPIGGLCFLIGWGWLFFAPVKN